jgi:hypothetical protein
MKLHSIESMNLSGVELLKMLSLMEMLLIEVENSFSLNMNRLEDLLHRLIMFFLLM